MDILFVFMIVMKPGSALTVLASLAVSFKLLNVKPMIPDFLFVPPGALESWPGIYTVNV